jgi:hypothetical protein
MVFHSMLDWDLKHEDGWEVEQLEAGKEKGVTKYQTKAWCSKSCKDWKAES